MFRIFLRQPVYLFLLCERRAASRFCRYVDDDRFLLLRRQPKETIVHFWRIFIYS